MKLEYAQDFAYAGLFTLVTVTIVLGFLYIVFKIIDE